MDIFIFIAVQIRTTEQMRNRTTANLCTSNVDDMAQENLSQQIIPGKNFSCIRVPSRILPYSSFKNFVLSNAERINQIFL